MLKFRFGGGPDFDPFWHPFLLIFLREMTKNRHLTNHWVFSLQFFCNDVITRAPKHQKSFNLMLWLIWCGHLAVKSMVHATAH